MEPTDLTIRVLQDIRDEIKGLRADQQEMRAEFNVRFEQINLRFEEVNARFEVIETALRDLAQQLVILGRGVKVAIESRTSSEHRLDDLERRVISLEERQTG